MDFAPPRLSSPERDPAKSRNVLGSIALRVFFVALVVRLLAIGIFGETHQPELWEYGVIARNVVAGVGYERSYRSSDAERRAGRPDTLAVPSAYMPPAYPFLLAAMLEAFGDHPQTFSLILILQSVAGALSAVLLYLFSKRIFPENTAALAGFLCALYPPFVYATLDFGTTTFYLLILGSVLLLLLDLVTRPGALKAIWTGICGALLALLRPEGAILVAVLSLFLLFRHRIRHAVVVLIILIIGLTPWMLRNFTTFHSFVPITTSFGLNFWRGNNAAASGTGRDTEGHGVWGSENVDRQLSRLSISSKYEIDRDQIYLRDGLQFVEDHPAEEGMLIIKKIFYFWVLDLTHPKARSLPYAFSWGILLIFFVVGLYYSRVQRYNIRPLLAYYATMTAIVAVFFVQPRYQILLSYGIIPVSAAGLQYSVQACKSLFLDDRSG